MDSLVEICTRMYTMMPVPLSLTDEEGHYLHCWPESIKGIVRAETARFVIGEYSRHGGDALHPLILFVNSGFFVGVMEPLPERYLIIGLVSPFHHSRKELMEMCAETILPDQLQHFCDMTLRAPLVTLTEMRAFTAIMTRLISGQSLSDEAILLCDMTSGLPDGAMRFEDEQFRQREKLDAHAAVDYEDGVCQAIEAGRPDMLTRALYAAPGGSIGMMSPDPLRQLRYAFISFVTLITRAAIRGGLAEETAFLLSDLYCQRMDALQETSEIERLLVGMAMDYCDKVAKSRWSAGLSPLIRKALNYITLHLHDSFGVDDLAEYCGIGRRSLAIRFMDETGMHITDYIQKEKISEARFLLEHTGLSLTEISAHLNYSSQSHFTQQFKKITGETPERYRRQRKTVPDTEAR